MPRVPLAQGPQGVTQAQNGGYLPQVDVGATGRAVGQALERVSDNVDKIAEGISSAFVFLNLKTSRRKKKTCSHHPRGKKERAKTPEVFRGSTGHQHHTSSLLFPTINTYP